MKKLHTILLPICAFVLLSGFLTARPLIDPIKFSITTDAKQVSVNEEFEVLIHAKYLSVPVNSAFVFEGANVFKLKVILPKGFQRTGGDFQDLTNLELSNKRPTATYRIKGKFIDASGDGTFQLLRGHRNASDASTFVQAGQLSFSVVADIEGESGNNKRMLAIDPVGYIPYLTMGQLRAGSADTARAVYIMDAGRFGFFRYDPSDTTTPDDSALVLISSAKRFKRITTFVTPEMFGAAGDGVTDDRKAIQSALNSEYKTIILSATYLIGATLNVPDNKRIIGQQGTITAANNSFINAFTINGKKNIYIEGINITPKAEESAFDYGIFINDSKNIEVQRCNISNIGREVENLEAGFGIVVTGSAAAAPSGIKGSENIRILNNAITNIKGYGNVRGDFVLIMRADKVIVENNYFNTCRRQGIAITDYATNIKVINNFILNTYLAGIDVERDNEGSITENITISKNTIKNFGSKPGSTIGVQFYGIDIHGGQKNIDIEGNHIIAVSSNALAGINCQNGSEQIKIVNNTIEGNNVLPTGMILYAGSGARNLIVSNNTIRGFRYAGINSYNNGFLTITSNRVESPIGLYGVYVNESSAIISDNIIKMSKDSSVVVGLKVMQSGLKRVQNNVVQVQRGTAYHLYTSIGYSSPGSTFANNSAFNLGSGNIGYHIELIGGAFPFTFVNNYADASFTTRVSPAQYDITTEYGTAAPATGYYARGSKVINSTPVAGGNVGWICVTAGTPGTWKTFGTIAP